MVKSETDAEGARSRSATYQRAGQGPPRSPDAAARLERLRTRDRAALRRSPCRKDRGASRSAQPPPPPGGLTGCPRIPRRDLPDAGPAAIGWDYYYLTSPPTSGGP